MKKTFKLFLKIKKKNYKNNVKHFLHHNNEKEKHLIYINYLINLLI